MISLWGYYRGTWNPGWFVFHDTTCWVSQADPDLGCPSSNTSVGTSPPIGLFMPPQSSSLLATPCLHLITPEGNVPHVPAHRDADSQLSSPCPKGVVCLGLPSDAPALVALEPGRGTVPSLRARCSSSLQGSITALEQPSSRSSPGIEPGTCRAKGMTKPLAGGCNGFLLCP